MKQISSYQAGCKLFNYASWNLLISCFSSFAGSVGLPRQRWGLSSTGCICLSDDLCHCDKWTWSDWWSTVNFLFHGVFARSCRSDPGRTQFTFWLNQNAWLGQARRQQTHAVNSKHAVYNLTQTSVLFRHSCSETALSLLGCFCRHLYYFHILYWSTQFVIQLSL